MQQILLGVRHGFTAFFTQRTEFRSGVSLLRPGALLTITRYGKNYSLLFLHTKSGDDPRGMGLRDDMLVRAVEFRRVLDRASAGGRANYMFLGDFNLMGMKYTHVREKDIEAEKEVLKLQREARDRDMRILSEDEPKSWWGGGEIPASSLDFVVAADHLLFAQFDGADVSVRGWPKLETVEERHDWVTRYSDHALLYFEVQRAARS